MKKVTINVLFKVTRHRFFLLNIWKLSPIGVPKKSVIILWSNLLRVILVIDCNV